MPDWTKTMSQTFEYYVVDPNTWQDMRKLDTVTSCSITKDLEADTLGSASFSLSESIGECYVRTYLVTIQNGVKERFVLGTYLLQTPRDNIDSKTWNVSADAYTPLTELTEIKPDLGYTILKNANILNTAYLIILDKTRVPVKKAYSDKTLYTNFIANVEDTYLKFLSDLLANANHTFDLSGDGEILFTPIQEAASLRPVWVYNDDNSSILYDGVQCDRDLYGIPNVVEIVCSTATTYYVARAVNDDPDSPTSTISRGREILYRVVNPSGLVSYDHQMVDDYAQQVLKEKSTLEWRVTYKHGYCPVRIGDCVILNYTKYDKLQNVKAKVISQSIDCVTGCPVSETAIFTTNVMG